MDVATPATLSVVQTVLSVGYEIARSVSARLGPVGSLLSFFVGDGESFHTLDAIALVVTLVAGILLYRFAWDRIKAKVTEYGAGLASAFIILYLLSIVYDVASKPHVQAQVRSTSQVVWPTPSTTYPRLTPERTTPPPPPSRPPRRLPPPPKEPEPEPPDWEVEEAEVEEVPSPPLRGWQQQQQQQPSPSPRRPNGRGG